MPHKKLPTVFLNKKPREGWPLWYLFIQGSKGKYCIKSMVYWMTAVSPEQKHWTYSSLRQSHENNLLMCYSKEVKHGSKTAFVQWYNQIKSAALHARILPEAVSQIKTWINLFAIIEKTSYQKISLKIPSSWSTSGRLLFFSLYRAI